MRRVALVSRVTDPLRSGSLSHRARTRRWTELSLRFPDLGEMNVLDLGGTVGSWDVAPVRPARLTAVNLTHHGSDRPDVRLVVGDACDLPESLRRERFDLVYSNSLLEHVGGHLRREHFADMVHSMAPAHWVQTPYRYFPVEPHWVFPAFQFLPVTTRASVSRHWPFGHISGSDRGEAVRQVLEVELVGLTEMRAYFPDSRIWMERFAGLPKSLVAVSTHHCRAAPPSPSGAG